MRVAAWLGACVLWACVAFDSASAQSATQESQSGTGPTAAQIQAFAESLTEVKFVGNFTVHGRDNTAPAKEEYFILSAKKLPEGDAWIITARIKYGNTDLTVPMTMDVKWAEKTPVITVDQMTIPGYGTFDARVLVHDGQYAGTWRHGEIGGHLMGRIEKLTPEELAELKKNIGRRKKSDQ